MNTARSSIVVVSVGSFLIENNLIAVAPDALAPSRANDSVLELAADPDALVKAQRFASDSRWPTKPDVLRGDAHAIAASGGAADTQPATVAPASTGSPTDSSTSSATSSSTELPSGSATIESRSKTAHLSGGERYIKSAAPPPAPPVSLKSAPASAPKQARLEPITKFDRLDVDGDGVLNRSEFAPVMSRGDRYGKVDTNADGVIEPQEFDAYEQGHAAAN